MKLINFKHNNVVNNKIINDSIRLLQKISLENIEINAKPIREYITSQMSSIGWSNRVIIHPDTNISITGMSGKTALCIQLGNICRCYADAMKLEYLFKSNKCKNALYILPTTEFCKKLSGNISNFERFTNELKIFNKIITIPILVLGFEI